MREDPLPAPPLGGELIPSRSAELSVFCDAFEAIYEGSFDDLKRALELKAAVMEFAEEERGPQSCIKQDLDILRTKAEAGDKQAVFSLYCSCLHAQNVLWQLANHTRCILMLKARTEDLASILKKEIINLKNQIEHEKD